MNNTVRVGINMSDIQENTHSSLLAAKNPRDERKEDIVSHQSEPGPRMSQRSRVPTTKGKEYQDYQLQRDYVTAVRAWRKQANKAEAVLVDSNDVELLQQERTKLDSRMDDLSEIQMLILNT